MKFLKTIGKSLAILLILTACFFLTGCFESRIEKLFAVLNNENLNMTVIAETTINETTENTITIEFDGNNQKIITKEENYYSIVDGGIDIYQKSGGKWKKTFIPSASLEEDMTPITTNIIFPEGITAESFDLLDGKYSLTDAGKVGAKKTNPDIENIYVSYDTKDKIYTIEFSMANSQSNIIYISNIGKTAVTLPNVD